MLVVDVMAAAVVYVVVLVFDIIVALAFMFLGMWHNMLYCSPHPAKGTFFCPTGAHDAARPLPPPAPHRVVSRVIVHVRRRIGIVSQRATMSFSIICFVVCNSAWLLL